jgi:hypothetical protein
MSGRPTKLCPEVRDKIVQAIRAGNYIETAAAYAGIAKDTLYAWLRRGAAGTEPEYSEFAAAVEQALASAETRDVALIGQAAEKEWQAAAWRLERKFPDRWGRKYRHELEAGARHGSLEGLLEQLGLIRKARAQQREIPEQDGAGEAPQGASA